MAWIRCTGNTGGSLKVRTASGQIATFETNMADVLQEVKCEINATGGNGTPDNPNPINGYSSANITRCGVNLWNEEWVTGGIISDGSIDTSLNNRRTTSFITVPDNSTVYMACPNNALRGRYAFYDSAKNLIYYDNDGPLTNSISTPSGARYMRITLGVNYGTTYNNDISVNYPSTDTSYHAYNGQTYTIAFGQTVYGGVLDVTRGKLHVTWNIIDLGDDTLNYSYNSTYHRFDCSNDLGAKPAPDNATPANALCSCYKNGCVNDVGTDDKFFYIAPASGQGKLRIVDTNYSNVATFKAAVAGQKIAFELATPFDIDLTPEVISAIVGVNNVFADCGETTVKYLTVE